LFEWFWLFGWVLLVWVDLVVFGGFGFVCGFGLFG
jgi:hypothetical protein